MSKGIVCVLASAVVEWMLIIMLLINASFAYVITLFARHYELQSPCLVCSRLDHLLGRKKWKFYTDLICASHRSEISSLVLCHAHNNLADVRLMCDNCLLSFATTSKYNAETYRLLLGKESLDHTRCSCCNEPRIPRRHTDALTRAGVPSLQYSKLEISPVDDLASVKPMSRLPDALEHGLEKINCPGRCSHDTTTSITSDLDDVSPDSEESPVEGLKEKPSIIADDTSALSHTAASSEDIAFDSFQNDTPSDNSRAVQIEASEGNPASLLDVSSTSKATSVAPESPSLSKLVSLADVLPSSDEWRAKLAVGDRGRRLSSALAEQWLAKDSSRTSEDMKQLLSQLSATRESSMSPRVLMSPRIATSSSPRVAMSPKLSLNIDEWRTNDPFNAIVTEIEGETLVDRLKRQIEHDRKLLAALYEELEVERNASAIAANQALAMINRLQEEKASLHMEALQCVRMMEEQAEFDMEALDKTNDLLADREKEIQDLEAELEYYRGDETMLDSALPEDQVMAAPISGASEANEDVSQLKKLVFGAAESHETFYSVDGSPQSTTSTQSN